MIVMLNNKSNFLKDEYLEYQKKLNSLDKRGASVVVFPSDVYLSFYDASDIKLGSQNVSRFDVGSHTGEVSASQLKSLGESYALVGHSERRSEEKEDNNIIREKIKRLVDADIRVVLCVGETREERENKDPIQVVLDEVKSDLDGIDIDYNKLVIAYEPIWSIGTGNIPRKEDIEEMISSLKEFIPVKVLYGGSVDSLNVLDVISKSCDGLLLGKSSINIEELDKIFDKIKNC